MWVMTPIGFFSVVQKTRGSEGLCVRARVADDLDTLRETYLPTLTPTETSAITDYAFRGFCTHEEWAQALAAMGRDIHYSNFKDEVEKTQGVERHNVYARVWGVLLSLQRTIHDAYVETWPLLTDDVPDDNEIERQIRDAQRRMDFGIPDFEPPRRRNRKGKRGSRR